MNPRLRRLRSDYELIREVFSGHPHVLVEPLGERLPPVCYRIQFRLRGLYLNEGRPDYRDVHTVELTLPRRYPAEKPYAVPLAPIFHPNIREYFCIADHWSAGTSLTDVIVKLGDMIQWRVYNISSPLDPTAAQWAAEQEPHGLFPIDNVNLGVADVEVRRTTVTNTVAPVPERLTTLPAPIEPTGPDGDELVKLLTAPMQSEPAEEQ